MQWKREADLIYRNCKCSYLNSPMASLARCALRSHIKINYSSVYFHHIGKTGGTTVDSGFRQWFGTHFSYPEKGVTFRILKYAKQYVYFSGHMPWQITKLLPQPCFVLTTVRSPVQQFLSLYKQIKRVGTSSIHLSHRTTPLQSLDDYLSDEKLYQSSLNPQTFSVGRELNWSEFVHMSEKTKYVNWKASTDKNNPNYYFLCGTRADDRVSRTLLERAKIRLQQPNTIAIPTEAIDEEFPFCFTLATGSRRPWIPRRLNSAPLDQEFELTRSQIVEIESRTKLDQELYDYVCNVYKHYTRGEIWLQRTRLPTQQSG